MVAFAMNCKHLVLFWAMTAAGVLVSGCASSQMRRIDASRDIYETWPIEIKQAVLDGKVEPGMTPEMVEVAWGKPDEVIHSSGEGEEVWVYRSGGSEPIYTGGGGAGYPGGMGGGMGGSSIGISTGAGGGTSVRSSTGVGIGAGGIGIGGGGGYPTGMGGPVLPGTPLEESEVVFRNGVVHRADLPLPK